MKSIGIGIVLLGLMLVALGTLQSPLYNTLIQPTDTAQFLAALQNKALTIHIGLTLLVVGTVVGTGGVIVAALNKR